MISISPLGQSSWRVFGELGGVFLSPCGVLMLQGTRHENISLLMIKADSPGVTIQRMDLIAMEALGGGQHFVFFDNVRVPSENLIGDEGKGWAMANTTLELEHGGTGSVGGAPQQGRGAIVTRIIDYLKAK